MEPEVSVRVSASTIVVIVGASLVCSLARSTRTGDGRASEAVDESIGVAVDEETTAGTEEDLIILARRAVRSATDLSSGSDATVGDVVVVFGLGLMALRRPSAENEGAIVVGEVGDLSALGFGLGIGGAGFVGEVAIIASNPVFAFHCSASLAGFATGVGFTAGGFVGIGFRVGVLSPV